MGEHFGGIRVRALGIAVPGSGGVYLAASDRGTRRKDHFSLVAEDGEFLDGHRLYPSEPTVSNAHIPSLKISFS